MVLHPTKFEYDAAGGQLLKNGHRIIPSIILCLVILLSSSSVLQAQSDKGVVVFKRIGFLGLEDRTHQGLAKNIGKEMRRELAATFRFEVIPQQNPSKELPLSAPDLSDMGKKFELDGIITGIVEIKGKDLKIVLTLFEGETGDPFAREFIVMKDWKSPEAVEKGVRTIMDKLIGRLPYQAVVTEVKDKGKTITINAGRLQGLGDGMKLQIFRIVKVNRHPFTREMIGVEKVNVGDLTVVRADERFSIIKPSRLLKGQTVEKGQYVHFKPSPKVLSELTSRRDELLAQQERDWMAMEQASQREKQAKEREVKEKRSLEHKVSRGKLELSTGLGWAKFSLTSDQLALDRKISTFPLAGVSGEYWVVPSLGLDADYQIGFVKLDRLSNSGSINVHARPYWYAIHLQYRYILWPGRTDLELIGRIGYAWYTYPVSSTDSQFFTNTRYYGPSIGFEGRLLLTSNLATGIGVDYLPILKVNEHPVNNGDDASSHAIRFHAEGRYRLKSNLWISIRYLFRDYIINFSGTGTKGGGITNAKTTDDLNSVLLGLSTEF
ncbi:MAG: hypothetical protein HY283_10555 [Nitrospirae bacterium]|nr:hypothetical protein [Nitrospirota bacterium]